MSMEHLRPTQEQPMKTCMVTFCSLVNSYDSISISVQAASRDEVRVVLGSILQGLGSVQERDEEIIVEVGGDSSAEEVGLFIEGILRDMQHIDVLLREAMQEINVC